MNKKDVFSSNEVMSILENMSDGIQLVSEQHGEVVKRLDKLQDDVTEIKHKLSQKVDLEDFQKLEKRLIKVEKRVFAR